MSANLYARINELVTELRSLKNILTDVRKQAERMEAENRRLINENSSLHHALSTTRPQASVLSFAGTVAE